MNRVNRWQRLKDAVFLTDLALSYFAWLYLLYTCFMVAFYGAGYLVLPSLIAATLGSIAIGLARRFTRVWIPYVVAPGGMAAALQIWFLYSGLEIH